MAAFCSLAGPTYAQTAVARISGGERAVPLGPTKDEPKAPKVVASLAGEWGGQLTVPGNTVAVHLAVTETAGRLTAFLETSLAKLNRHTLTVTQRHDTVRFYDPAAEISFVGLRSANGQQLVGRWQQPGFVQNLALDYGVAPLVAAAPKAAARNIYGSKWASGTLEGDRPVGEWKYFRRGADGQFEVAQIYDHSTGKLLYGSSNGEASKVELSPGQWGFTPLSQSPWFIGGYEALLQLTNQVQYPPDAVRASVQGTIIVSFVVDTLGHLSDHRIVRGLGRGCDEEALRVVKTIPDTWTPGRLGTKAVATLYYLTLAFKMN
jgi:periplasmic protein TonB